MDVAVNQLLLAASLFTCKADNLYQTWLHLEWQSHLERKGGRGNHVFVTSPSPEHLSSIALDDPLGDVGQLLLVPHEVILHNARQPRLKDWTDKRW